MGEGGPRKGAVLSDRVEVAAGSPEARGYRVADREVAKPMEAIDRFFRSLDREHSPLRLCSAVGGGSRLGTKSCDSASSAVLAEGWLY
jgi:hypothetical protein